MFACVCVREGDRKRLVHMQFYIHKWERQEKLLESIRQAIHSKLLFPPCILGIFGVIFPSCSLVPSAVTTRHHNYSTSATETEGKLRPSPSLSLQISLTNNSCAILGCKLLIFFLLFIWVCVCVCVPLSVCVFPCVCVCVQCIISFRREQETNHVLVFANKSLILQNVKLESKQRAIPLVMACIHRDACVLLWFVRGHYCNSSRQTFILREVRHNILFLFVSFFWS